MKSKLRNLLLAAMALTLFAGCGNLALNDATFEGSDAGDKCVLTISYSDLEGLLTETPTNRSARTIDPKKYTKGDNTSFKIEGTSARKLKLKIGETEAADGLYGISFDSNNKANLALDYDVWYLTLHAYEGTGDNAKEVLRGVTTVDLTKEVENNTINFILSTKGVTSEGGLNITVTGLTPAVKSYTAGLYDINTDELKYNLLASADGENLDDGDAETPLPTSKQLTKSGVLPGDYIFKFIPYNDTVENKNTREDLTPYSDVITIAPARTTTASVALSIMQVPAAPTGFSVSLVADKDDYYTVHLEWQDMSTNEENFVLSIYEVVDAEYNDDPDLTAEGAKTAVQKAVEAGALKKAFDKDFFDSVNAYYVEGTLGMSTQECDIKLPTGHLYEFTLAAKNRAGKSAPCYREASTAADGFKIATTGTNPKYVSVNRQKITYNYMGGTRSETTDTGLVSSSDNKVVYRTYDRTAYTLMTIANTTADPNVATSRTDKLIYNDHPWKEWTTLPNAGDPISTIDATEYADKMVYASYNQNVNVIYSVADEYRTLDVGYSLKNTTFATKSENLLTLNTKPRTTDDDGNPLATPTPSDVWGGQIVFELANSFTPYPTTKEPNPAPVTISACDKIIVIINGGKPYVRDNPVKRDTNYIYEMSLNNFRTSGVYNITIIGEIDGHYYSGAPIALTVDIK